MRGDFVHAGYLSKNYRVVMFDHLGFGFSDKPKDYSYSLTEQAEQVKCTTRDILKTPKKIQSTNLNTFV